MSGRMKFFIFSELLLFLWFVYQISSNFFLLIVLFMGLYLLFRNDSASLRRRTNHNRLGLLFVLFSVLSTQAAWLMGLVAIIFMISPYFGNSHQSAAEYKKKPPWHQKEFFAVDSLGAKSPKAEFQKMTWLGRDYIGKTAFEWDDINFTKFMGETVIDLGNTILPNKENTIVIRKVVGNTKILVPSEVGITVNYSTLFGKFKNEDDNHTLKNEQIKYVEDHYDEKPRKLHIVVNVLIGELEVISL